MERVIPTMLVYEEMDGVVWVNTGSETVMFDDQLTAQPWDDAFALTPDLSLSIGRCVREYLRAE